MVQTVIRLLWRKHEREVDLKMMGILFLKENKNIVRPGKVQALKATIVERMEMS